MTHIANSKERFIEEQHHSKEEEKHPKARQPHSNFCWVSLTKKAMIMAIREFMNLEKRRQNENVNAWTKNLK